MAQQGMNTELLQGYAHGVMKRRGRGGPGGARIFMKGKGMTHGGISSQEAGAVTTQGGDGQPMF